MPPQLARPHLEQLGLFIRVDVYKATRAIAQRCRLDDSVLLEKLVEKAAASDAAGDFELSLEERQVPRGQERTRAGYKLRPARLALLRELAELHHVAQVRLVEALVLRAWRHWGGGTPGGYQGPDDVEELLRRIIDTSSGGEPVSARQVAFDFGPQSSPDPQSGLSDGAGESSIPRTVGEIGEEGGPKIDQ